MGSNLEEGELNYIFEHFTRETEEKSLDAYLDSAPKPKPKESEILKKADGTVVEMPQPKHRPEKKKVEQPAPRAQARGGDQGGGHPHRGCEPGQIQREVYRAGLHQKVENRRKPHPAGNKQKFGNAGKNRGRQPFRQPFQKSARPRPSACSASSWRRPARPSSRCRSRTRSPWANWPAV